MAQVTPSAPRARTTENGQELRVFVPARRDLLLAAFMLTFIVSPYLRRETRNDPFFLICGAVFAVGATFCLLWQAKGVEEIAVSDTAFSVRYSLFGGGKAWEFDPGKMRDLRVSSNYVAMSTWTAWFGTRRKNKLREWNPTGIWCGPLAFDYGAKTYRFGAGLDEAEARDVLPHLLRRLSTDDPAALFRPPPAASFIRQKNMQNGH